MSCMNLLTSLCAAHWKTPPRHPGPVRYRHPAEQTDPWIPSPPRSPPQAGEREDSFEEGLSHTVAAIALEQLEGPDGPNQWSRLVAAVQGKCERLALEYDMDLAARAASVTQPASLYPARNSTTPGVTAILPEETFEPTSDPSPPFLGDAPHVSAPEVRPWEGLAMIAEMVRNTNNFTSATEADMAMVRAFGSRVLPPRLLQTIPVSARDMESARANNGAPWEYAGTPPPPPPLEEDEMAPGVRPNRRVGAPFPIYGTMRLVPPTSGTPAPTVSAPP